MNKQDTEQLKAQQTKGSWIIYQTGKFQKVTDQSNFESTYFAGKAGILLSAISGSSPGTLDAEKLRTLAKASHINTRIELPSLLDYLSKRGLVDKSSTGGVALLGVTTAACLAHTADIFDSLSPSPVESAALDLCESSSIEPQKSSEIAEELGDRFRLSSSQRQILIDQSCQINFVDSENIDSKTQLLFNGNLFRRDAVSKINKIISSLTTDEARKQRDFSELLTKRACIQVEDAKRYLGDSLFTKLASVAIYDVNVVSNGTEEVGYVTRPSAFAKFSNSMVDDAFDLAKMFVSSLTYGMTRSSHARGQIHMIDALMGKLISGEAVGPVTAIGEDYKILEMKHVVKVFEGSRSGRRGYMMKLLKREVGELALEVIKKADVSAHSLTELPSAALSGFRGPEANRFGIRRKEIALHPRATNDLLLSLRTGGRSK